MSEADQDNANVVVLPPVLLLASVAAGIILDWFLPLGDLAQLPGVPRLVVGALLIALGISMPIRVRRAFIAAGTNIRPDMPSTALVTTGLFAHARNPVYVGGALALIGMALLLGSAWILVLTVPALLVLHYGVVLREEAYLERKFGAAYLAYKTQVPRYGWKF